MCNKGLTLFYVIHITHIHSNCVKDQFKPLPPLNNDKTIFWKEVIFPVRKIKKNLHHWKVQGFFVRFRCCFLNMKGIP